MVTSISVLTDNDPDSVRQKYERDYKKYSVESMQATVTQPKFKFYLYNEGTCKNNAIKIHGLLMLYALYLGKGGLILKIAVIF